MRVRDFLRGFSLGMIVTCFVLFIVFKGSNQISDEYVIERAKQLNMVFKDEEETFLKQDNKDVTNVQNTIEQNTEEQNTAQQNTAEQNTTQQNTAQQNTTQQNTTQQNTTEQNTTEQNTTQQSTSQQNTDNSSNENSSEETVETVTIDVEVGMASEDVANMLYDLGVIDDVVKFCYYLHNNGYSLRVNVGTYEIPINASYEQIARIITKSKKTLANNIYL